MSVGEIYKLPAIGEAGKDAAGVQWSSSDDAVASVDEKGFLSAKAAGNVKLTATTSNGKQAVVEVNVSAE